MKRALGLFLTGVAFFTLPVLPTRATSVADSDTAIARELAEPFSYFIAQPVEIGFKDSPVGFAVTPAGEICSHFGDLQFSVGQRDEPLDPRQVRVRSFEDGYLPIVNFSTLQDGIEYKFQTFATPYNLNPRKNLIALIRVTLSNQTEAVKDARLGVTFSKPQLKPGRPPVEGPKWFFREYTAGYKVRPVWWRAMKEVVWSDDPAQNETVQSFRRQRAEIKNSFQIKPAQLWNQNHLVLGYPSAGLAKSKSKSGPQLRYKFKLKPAQEETILLKMPYVPVAAEKKEALKEALAPDYDDYYGRIVEFWQKILDERRTRFVVPEKKVVDTLKSSLAYDLMARYQEPDGNWLQTISCFIHRKYYTRDCAYFVHAYDLMGLEKVAKEIVEYTFKMEDGVPVGFKDTVVRHPDYWGQILWTCGTHLRLTGDRELMKKVSQVLPGMVAELRKQLADDPKNLWPVSGSYDNEKVNGHYTGHNLWALLGLRQAIYISKTLGHDQKAAEWEAFYESYKNNFLTRLRRLTAETGGYIPPGMDDPRAGCDWANASGGTYPFGVLSATDPLASATLYTIYENSFSEGIARYGKPNAWWAKERDRTAGWLHHYMTFYVLQGFLRVGDQEKAVEGLYSVLVHTDAANGGFEFSVKPWETRDPGANVAPHGWFAARYMAFLRNMLIREEEDSLHLASALAPLWTRPGKEIKVENAPTYFGDVSYHMRSHKDGATINLESTWREKPRRLWLHIPWYVEVDAVVVDGKSLKVSDGRVELPLSANKISLRWRRDEVPRLSYKKGVRNFLNLWHRRPADADYRYIF